MKHPKALGKFLFIGDEKFIVRGVAYGPFHPDDSGSEYHGFDQVDADFAAMAANGINTVRTYTVPPRWVLDLAMRHGLRVMVGLPWEQHIAFLDRAATARDIVRRVAEGVRNCAGHPAVLAYAIGNEIPCTIVRWYGARRVERFLSRLCDAARREDPGALVTYVNYPSTEYLDLRFLDFVAFNVYLETPEKFSDYVAHLQNIAENRPLVIAEMGLDEVRNGAEKQATTLAWQIDSAFRGGCAGAVVFSWTDEWYRGGYDITDWRFGLTTSDRKPKPALQSVKEAYDKAPLPRDFEWPLISVVVCTHNGISTIEQCLQGVSKLKYPNYELIVVNDGSRPELVEIVKRFDTRLITLPERRGLSYARNVGLKAARGEFVAYLDDDAWPDPHWLHYIAEEFAATNHVGIGGPNVPPPNDTLIARSVAVSPGGPIHVLLTDTVAEHIPGCNMVFRKSALIDVDGFDPQFQ
ncbi:MAG TPA: glycosyltransferase, partial [Tepidisphaeraceae bacterium]|nr:glycosyltransferase [Tepidisphaeraceae bacterium]